MPCSRRQVPPAISRAADTAAPWTGQLHCAAWPWTNRRHPAPSAARSDGDMGIALRGTCPGNTLAPSPLRARAGLGHKHMALGAGEPWGSRATRRAWGGAEGSVPPADWGGGREPQQQKADGQRAQVGAQRDECAEGDAGLASQGKRHERCMHGNAPRCRGRCRLPARRSLPRHHTTTTPPPPHRHRTIAATATATTR